MLIRHDQNICCQQCLHSWGGLQKNKERILQCAVYTQKRDPIPMGVRAWRGGEIEKDPRVKITINIQQERREEMVYVNTAELFSLA